MKSMILVATLACLSPLVAAAAEDFAPAKIEVAKSRAPREGGVNQYYWGKVTEVTKNSITIEWPGEKPKKFTVSETLAAGKVPMTPRPMPGSNHKYTVTASSMYRLKDVKAGDNVSIYFAHIDGVSICDHICINKRPGGRVPPLPEEAEALRRKMPDHVPYHEWMNAYWDLEDKGIPFPEKFGAMRRWSVAPMPREVKIGPPTMP